MKHLLVPLDGSGLAASVVPVARTLALATDATVRLVTVEPQATPLGSARAAAAYLDGIAESLRSANVSVQTNVRVGEPALAIVRWANECGADAIVMASHGRTGLGRWLIGSVADRVLLASRVPVLLLRPALRQVDRIKTILVPLDGSPGAAFALTAAAPIAQASGARLLLVCATVPSAVWFDHPGLGDAFEEERSTAAESYARSMAARLRRIGLNATGYGVSGLPADAIVNFADRMDADLIVMSTHARLGVARSLLGSVADEVVRRSGRPVLLMRQNPPPRQPNALLNSETRRLRPVT